MARAEAVLRGLGLQYRVLDLCVGELGNQNARTYDLEAYAPGVDRWLEVSSVSWYRDYQARRANVRYRPSGGGSPVMAHTVNGSVLGWARVFAAVVETYRQPDGSIAGARRPRPLRRRRRRSPRRRGTVGDRRGPAEGQAVALGASKR